MMQKDNRLFRSVPAILFFALLIWMAFSSGSVSAVQPDITIEINGVPAAFTDAHPYIDENNRTMVPVRFVSEQLGAQVDWDGSTQTVTIRKDYDVIRLTLNRARIWVNGETMEMDTRMALDPQTNRSYVPLRFVSENLGTALQVDQGEGFLFIGISPAPRENPVGIYQIRVGDEKAHVLETVGQPDQREPTPYGYTWWVYGTDDSEPYFLVGMSEDKVVTLYANGTDWHIRGVSYGTGGQAARETLRIQNRYEFMLGPSHYSFQQRSFPGPRELDYVVLENHTLMVLYYDIHQNGQVTAIRLLDLPLVPKMGMIALQWTYPSDFPPDHSVPPLTETEQNAVNRASERLLFDLVNETRRREGLTTLKWHESVSRAAYAHSVDMKENRFFSHDSPTTGSPADRVTAAGISFRYLLENIAMGQMDPLDAHEGLMNSLSHRRAILDRQVTHVGIGVASRYYTENFLQP